MAGFPNVPNAPGVPALSRNPLATILPIVLLTADVLGRFGISLFPRWGIFLNGSQVLFPDSVIAFDYKQNWVLADFPIEEGGFESYDKVDTPYDARMRMVCGGSTARRQTFLNAVEAIADTTLLYDIVTPEQTYMRANVTRYDYRRTAREGLGLLTVDLWLLEVRVGAEAQFSSTKSPSGAQTVNGGTVQPSSSFDESGFT